MQNVTAPKEKGKMTITVKAVGFGRGMPVPPSRKHKDRVKAARKNACRNKGRNRNRDW